MVLWFLKTKIPMYSLCLIFRGTGNTVRAWLDLGLKVLDEVVTEKRVKKFKIRRPTFDEMKASTA